MSSNAMIKELMSSIDKMDADKFASFLHDDVTFKFGNAEPVNGNELVKQYVAGFFGAIKGLSHTVDTYVENGESIFFRGNVTYTRKDSSTLTVPYTNYFSIKNGKIKDYQIYADTSQLFG